MELILFTGGYGKDGLDWWFGMNSLGWMLLKG
jgi:hypothetical protein